MRTLGRDPARRLVRRLHRWLGLGAAFFVVFLSLTGIALNHSASLNFDSRYLNAGWLRAWYGIAVPAPTSSFAAGNRRVTLLGSRLYLDDEEIESQAEALVGFASLGPELVVATSEALVFLAPDGAVVERIGIGAELPAPISAMTTADERLILHTGEALYAMGPQGHAAEIAEQAASFTWPEPSTVPVDLLRRIESNYGGSGINFEQFLYDIHSGRILNSIGVWAMDLVAIILILVAGTGFVVWLKR